MGCAGSKPPLTEAEFLEAHKLDTNPRTLLYEPSAEIVRLAYPAALVDASRFTSISKQVLAANSISEDNLGHRVHFTVHSLDEETAMRATKRNLLIDLPAEGSSSSSTEDPAPPAHNVDATRESLAASKIAASYKGKATRRMFKSILLQCRGVNSNTILRLEMYCGDGTKPVGMLLAMGKKDEGIPAEMFVYSVRRRSPSQPQAVELAFSNHQSAVPTSKPLTMSGGQPLYSWARVRDLGTVISKYQIFLANVDGSFDISKGAEAFSGGAPSFTSSGGRNARVLLKKGSKGCAMIARTLVPPNLLGFDPGKRKGKPADAWTISVAAGIDPILMLGVTVLAEKASLRAHYPQGV